MAGLQFGWFRLTSFTTYVQIPTYFIAFEPNPVKLETSHPMIFAPVKKVSVLCITAFMRCFLLVSAKKLSSAKVKSVYVFDAQTFLKTSFHFDYPNYLKLNYIIA